jgi:hypothetical protein
MAMQMDPEYKDRIRKIADKKARMKGRMDPEAQPGFKPRPSVEKVMPKKLPFDKSKKRGITTLPMKPGMTKNPRLMKKKDK